MPRHVDDLRNSDSFPVKPGTNEYHALSFLVANREFGFTPAEIAERTTISEASASKTMTRLFDKGLVERAQGTYYVEPERADELQRRLDSLDAAARMFERAPDDAYAEPGWEADVPSIDPDEARPTTNNDARTSAADADAIISDLTDSDDGA
jgi:DNA-binding MarR family transcriptional regulator